MLSRFSILLVALIIPLSTYGQNIPENAHQVPYGKGWECDRGYHQKNYDSTTCTKVKVPENAVLNYLGNDWICKFPYAKRNNKCVGVSKATDQEIRELIIKRSISNYSGNCPCPYNRDSAGRRCGGRSAYSRAGGYSPICYKNQISPSEVLRFRRQHGN